MTMLDNLAPEQYGARLSTWGVEWTTTRTEATLGSRTAHDLGQLTDRVTAESAC